MTDDCPDPGTHEIDLVSMIIKENPGHKKTELYRIMASQESLSYVDFSLVLCYLLKTHRIAKDSDENYCWIFNQKLTQKYLSRPELLVK